MDNKPEKLLNSLPDIEIPKGFLNTDSYLRKLTLNGLQERYLEEKQIAGKIWEKIKERAEYELDIIIKNGFANYFLIVMDYVNWAINQNIQVGPGRGTATSSIVAYALHITNIDPLKFNLIFERFINPERIVIPDFDVDFSTEGRDDVIKYVIKKYGSECVKNIFVFSKKEEYQKPEIHPCGIIIAKKKLLILLHFHFQMKIMT
jgi:DNA polymerase-3 subunit alpha